MSSDEPDTKTRILTQTWRLLEHERGHGVRIEDVARAARLSRQAVYLHFRSRAELLIATARYVDQIHGVYERLAEFRLAKGGSEILNTYVDFWGNYLPQIHGLARALMESRENDKAAAAAWNDRMDAVRDGCQCIIDCLEREHVLAKGWTNSDAVDMMWGMLSVTLWENLTIERGWSQSQYLHYIKEALQQIFVKSTGDH
ncbi:MAG: hypothetical protein A2Y88_02250 [Chloroflexi bacterium RBG_13_48_10]|nr:MAG: hypothetical protein A2Y88_02250 [Chloroflexi bacterium RBG_13_48_10]